MQFLKLITLLLSLWIAAISVDAQVPATILEGEVSGYTNAHIVLFRKANGLQKKYAEISLTKNANRFSFAMPVAPDGEFVKLIITQFDAEGIKEKNRRHYHVELFLKRQDILTVRIDLQQMDLQPAFPNCTLVSNSEENTILLNWQKMFQQFNASFADADEQNRVEKFSPAYSQNKAKLSGFISAVSCQKNPHFEQTFKEGAQAKLQFAPIDFYFSNQQIIDEAASPAFKKLLKLSFADLKAYCGDALFRMEGVANLKRYYQILYRKSGKATAQGAGLGVNDDSVKALICSKTVKKYYAAKTVLELDKFSKEKVGFPQTEEGSGYAFIRVHLEGFTYATEFKLTAFEVVGNRTLMSVQSADPYFLVPVPLSVPTFVSFNVYDLNAKLLLQPGGNVDLHIYNGSGDPSGKKYQAKYAIRQGSVDNHILASWYSFSNPVTKYLQSNSNKPVTSAGNPQFENDFNHLNVGLKTFMADSIKGSSVGFQQMFKSLSDYELRLSGLLYLARLHLSTGYGGPLFKGFQSEKVPSFFKQFGDGKILCDSSIYKFPDSHLLVNYISKLQWALLPEAQKEKMLPGSKLGYQLDQLCLAEAKSCLLSWENMVNEPSNWREFRQSFLPNKAFFVTDDLMESYDRMIHTLAPDTQFIGMPVIDVAFADTSGKKISLHDFIGKVVLIDVWATWCAPCRVQLPFLKKIEEEYSHNPDMVFVGLSVDREKDQGKWKKFVADEKLQGVQILDHGGKIFQKKYEFTAIPRFILIDRNGNISEVRCPMPENEKELKAYLNELLQKPAQP